MALENFPHTYDEYDGHGDEEPFRDSGDGQDYGDAEHLQEGAAGDETDDEDGRGDADDEEGKRLAESLEPYLERRLLLHVLLKARGYGAQLGL